MKTSAVMATLILLMMACGKKETPAPAEAPKPEPTKPEPTKPEPAKPEPAKPEPAKPEPAKPEPGPAKPEPATDPTAAVDNLFSNEDEVEKTDIVIYVPETKTAYLTETYNVEGTGMGMTLVALQADKREEVEVHTADVDDEAMKAGVAKAKKELVAKLTGKPYVLLEGRAWPVENAASADAKAAARMELTDLGAILTFAKTKLAATDAEGKPLAELDLKADATPPHTPHVGQVYGKAGVGVIVVVVGFDPGDKYGEYNYFSKSYLMTLRP